MRNSLVSFDSGAAKVWMGSASTSPTVSPRICVNLYVTARIRPNNIRRPSTAPIRCGIATPSTTSIANGVSCSTSTSPRNTRSENPGRRSTNVSSNTPNRTSSALSSISPWRKPIGIAMRTALPSNARGSTRKPLKRLPLGCWATMTCRESRHVSAFRREPISKRG